MAGAMNAGLAVLEHRQDGQGRGLALLARETGVDRRRHQVQGDGHDDEDDLRPAVLLQLLDDVLVKTLREHDAS